MPQTTDVEIGTQIQILCLNITPKQSVQNEEQVQIFLAPALDLSCSPVEFLENLFIFWLHWVFVAALSSCSERGQSSLRCMDFSLRFTGFSLQWLLLLRSTGSRA